MVVLSNFPLLLGHSSFVSCYSINVGAVRTTAFREGSIRKLCQRSLVGNIAADEHRPANAYGVTITAMPLQRLAGTGTPTLSVPDNFLTTRPGLPQEFVSSDHEADVSGQVVRAI
jgi:hypothetical protein